MDTLKIPDDEPIQAKMISSSLESAQQRIEGFNFDARHHILEYDDVMNKHREIIYKKRREVLENKPFDVAAYEKYGLAKEEFEKKEAEVGKEAMSQIIKLVSLQVIDTLWQEHLSNMEHMRESVKLRSYGGKDPLIEYKNEGRNLFTRLLEEIDGTIANNILKANLQHSHQHQHQHAPAYLPPQQGESVGRNDFCPCGSGKKYKKCGMLNTEEHRQNMAKK